MNGTNAIIHRQEKIKVFDEHYKENVNIYIQISLDDDCKNGHEDFSITGEVFKHTSTNSKSDRFCITAGCIHDDILRHFPEYEIFIDLHLCDFEGSPMYSIGNGFYHLKNNQKDYLIKHWQITEEEFRMFKLMAEDEKFFHYLIQKKEINLRWQNKANEAIKKLQELTGKTFKSTATRRHFTPLTPEQMNEFEKLVNSGYYTPEAIEERRIKAIEEKKQLKLKNLQDDFIKKSNLAEIEYCIKYTLIKNGFNEKNVIFYTHTKEVTFNWNSSEYNKAFTEEEYKKAVKLLKAELLAFTNKIYPKKITYKLGNK